LKDGAVNVFDSTDLKGTKKF